MCRPTRTYGRHILLARHLRNVSVDTPSIRATCVAVIFPVCAVSAAVCLLRTDFDFLFALPYLIGGLLGGFLGGRLYGKVSPRLLRYLFAAFLLYAAVRYLT